MIKPWTGEKWRFFVIILIGLITGWATGYWVLSVLAAILGYLLWHLLQLKSLSNWLRRGANPDRVPDLTGAWEPVIHYIYRIQRRNRRRKARIRKFVKRSNEIATASPDAIVVLLANNQIDWSSRVAGHLLGIQYPQDVGERIENLIRHPEFHLYMKQKKFEEPLIIPSPLREDIELSIRIVTFGKGERLLTARDIGTFLRVQAMRRDFVANVSHELRTPLTVISGYLESLLDDDGLLKEHRLALESIQQQSKRMNNIVQDLLQLSRLESDQDDIENEDAHMPSLLAVLLSETVAASEALEHRIFFEIDENLSVLGSGKGLNSLVSNLLLNALRHTPSGTEVKVRWYRNKHGTAELQVEDSGPGIEAEHIPRLTERFYRVDTGRARSDGGSGLGLSIVKHIAQRHGAELRIESLIGKGTCFTVTFPVSRTLFLTLPKRVKCQ